MQKDGPITHVLQSELHRSWKELFDRLLWVPLRNLKGRSGTGYNYEHLFYHEFFSSQGQDDGYRLAKELWRNLRDTSCKRTLFLLDGLDEISQELGASDDMSCFMRDLLSQPNVIITSRPNATLPPSLQNPDLELETIGFYPDQVTAYLKADPKIKTKTDEVRSFLEKHWLIQGLVRIPIQLDALCYTWQGFDTGTVPDTMTRIYKAIELKLWKKDIVRLGKSSAAGAKSAQPVEIEHAVQSQIELLGCLAFNGLCYDIIDFTPTHRNEMAKKFLQPDSLKLSLDETLARISFLRTSDSSSKVEDRYYHFLHLTFQEYFAAQYFVRRWKDDKQLEFVFKEEPSTGSELPADPAEFLGRNKYSARYDILWRFVAGLLEAEKEKELLHRFFNIIEEEPLDLLGPAHQRLVMHCLSEIDSSTKLPIRLDLEAKLLQWVLFECHYTKTSHLVREMELPPRVLDKALRQACKETRTTLLQSLRYRPAIPLSTTGIAASWLGDSMSQDVTLAILAIFSRLSALADEVLQAIEARLADKDWYVRRAAMNALARQQGLSDEVLQAIRHD